MAWEWDIRIILEEEQDTVLLYFLTLAGLGLSFTVVMFSFTEILGILLAIPLAAGYCLLLAGEIKYIDIVDQASETTCAGFVFLWIVIDIIFLFVGVLGNWYIDPLLILLWYPCLYLYPVSLVVHRYFGPPSVVLLLIGSIMMIVSITFQILLPHLWLIGCIVVVFGMMSAG